MTIGGDFSSMNPYAMYAAQANPLAGLYGFAAGGGAAVANTLLMDNQLLFQKLLNTPAGSGDDTAATVSPNLGLSDILTSALGISKPNDPMSQIMSLLTGGKASTPAPADNSDALLTALTGGFSGASSGGDGDITTTLISALIGGLGGLGDGDSSIASVFGSLLGGGDAAADSSDPITSLISSITASSDDPTTAMLGAVLTSALADDTDSTDELPEGARVVGLASADDVAAADGGIAEVVAATPEEAALLEITESINELKEELAEQVVAAKEEAAPAAAPAAEVVANDAGVVDDGPKVTINDTNPNVTAIADVIDTPAATPADDTVTVIASPPAVVVETPAPVVETPAPVVETPAPVVPSPPAVTPPVVTPPVVTPPVVTPPVVTPPTNVTPVVDPSLIETTVNQRLSTVGVAPDTLVSTTSSMSADGRINSSLQEFANGGSKVASSGTTDQNRSFTSSSTRLGDTWQGDFSTTQEGPTVNGIKQPPADLKVQALDNGQARVSANLKVQVQNADGTTSTQIKAITVDLPAMDAAKLIRDAKAQGLSTQLSGTNESGQAITYRVDQDTTTGGYNILRNNPDGSIDRVTVKEDGKTVEERIFTYTDTATNTTTEVATKDNGSKISVTQKDNTTGEGVGVLDGTFPTPAQVKNPAITTPANGGAVAGGVNAANAANGAAAGGAAVAGGVNAANAANGVNAGANNNLVIGANNGAVGANVVAGGNNVNVVQNNGVTSVNGSIINTANGVTTRPVVRDFRTVGTTTTPVATTASVVPTTASVVPTPVTTTAQASPFVTTGRPVTVSTPPVTTTSPVATTGSPVVATTASPIVAQPVATTASPVVATTPTPMVGRPMPAGTTIGRPMPTAVATATPMGGVRSPITPSATPMVKGAVMPRASV